MSPIGPSLDWKKAICESSGEKAGSRSPTATASGGTPSTLLPLLPSELAVQMSRPLSKTSRLPSQDHFGLRPSSISCVGARPPKTATDQMLLDSSPRSNTISSFFGDQRGWDAGTGPDVIALASP